MNDAPRPPTRPVDLTAGDPLAALHRWLADTRVDDAARSRARRHSLQRQAADDATLLGVLVDLGEAGQPITVTTDAGRHLTGYVVAVGADFGVLRDARTGDTFVPHDRLAVVRSAPGGHLPTGDRPADLTLALGSALMELAPEQPEVILATPGEDIRGELLSVGTDLVTIALGGSRRDSVHVRLGAIDHLVMLDR